MCTRPYPVTATEARRDADSTRVQALGRTVRALSAVAIRTVQLRPRARLLIFIRTVRVIEAPGARERTDHAAALVRIVARALRPEVAFVVPRVLRVRLMNVAPAGTAAHRIVAGGVLRKRTP
jgi:hypothetical protein